MRRWIGAIIFCFTQSKGEETLNEIIRQQFQNRERESPFHALFNQAVFVTTDYLEIIKILFISKG